MNDPANTQRWIICGLPVVGILRPWGEKRRPREDTW
jgi:hypothetical protein